ncbi:MAG: ANTAR domain-containing protein [Pseudomonadota bacterium]
MANQIIQELSHLSALILHPNNLQAQEIIKQLERIGCKTTHKWPARVDIDNNFDVIFVYITDNNPSLSIPNLNLEKSNKPTFIAIIDYENPTMLELACELGVHSIITSPLKPFGLLSTLVVARKQWHQEKIFNLQINKLEKKVHEFRYVEKAVSIIEKNNEIDRDKAYAFIRKQAMNRRLTTEDIAKEIINADKALNIQP